MRGLVLVFTGVLFGLSSGANASSSDVEDTLVVNKIVEEKAAENHYPLEDLKYPPHPYLTPKLASLGKDYFADYFEYESKVFSEVSKKLREIKSGHINSTYASADYRRYLEKLTPFLTGIKRILVESLDELVIKSHMLHQHIHESENFKGSIKALEAKIKKCAEESNINKSEVLKGDLVGSEGGQS